MNGAGWLLVCEAPDGTVFYWAGDVDGWVEDPYIADRFPEPDNSHPVFSVVKARWEVCQP